jgi:hypothetical protein
MRLSRIRVIPSTRGMLRATEYSAARAPALFDVETHRAISLKLS